MIRDIALLVMLVITTLAVIIIYFKLSRLLDTAKRTLESVEGIVSTVVGEACDPGGGRFGSGIRTWEAGLVPVRVAQIRKRSRLDEEERYG